MKKHLFFAFGAAALLASCSSDMDNKKVNLYDGYLHVNGTVNEIKTRASDTEFDQNDEIGVSGGNYTNVQYTYDGSEFSSESGIKLSASSTKFTAYYPYNSSLENGNTIKFSVVGEDNTPAEGVDFMFAKEVSASTDSPEVEFNFSHMMSQLEFTVVDNTSTKELTNQTGTITLSNILVNGTFNVSDGTVEAGSPISEILLTSVLAGTPKQVIVPSYGEANKTSIKVVLAINDKTYSGSITPALAAGTRYCYNLKISDGGSAETGDNLTISTADVTGWTSENKDTNMKEEYQLKVGDFLLTDGSTVAPTEANVNKNKDEIVGVVFYLGPYDSYDNGLAIALNNSNGTAERFFSGNSSATLTSWYNGGEIVEGKESIFNGSMPTELKGLKNTNLLNDIESEFNYTELLESYNDENKVTDASEWFLPSFGELVKLSEVITKVKESISLAGGEFDAFTTFTANDQNENFYWSSDFYTNTAYNWAHPVGESEVANNNAYRVSAGNTKKLGYFRFAIAF